MKDLVIMHDRQAVTSSLQVATVFNKQHKNVVQTIENKINSAENSAQYNSMFSKGSYKDRSGKSNSMYYMNRDGFSFIAFGFTGRKADKFKLQYIEAFNEMEQQVKRPALPTSPRELAKLALNANEETNGRIDGIEEDLENLKDNQVISQPEYNALAHRINQRVSEVANSFGHVTQKQRGELFKDINGGVKKVANVSSRSMLRKKHYRMVMDFVNDWEPSTATKTIIRQTRLDFDDGDDD